MGCVEMKKQKVMEWIGEAMKLEWNRRGGGGGGP